MPATANDNKIPRRPRLRFNWRPITRASMMLSQGIEIKPDTVAGRRVVDYVCEWALYGANGERVCGSYPQGFRDAADARRAAENAAVLLLGLVPEDAKDSPHAPDIRGSIWVVKPAKKPELP